MTKNEAYELFNMMINVAREELFNFTLNSDISIETKADKSLVTECDKAIDKKLTEIAHSKGLQVISEEGEHVIEIVKSGNYITIDPIDGTLGYIEYVNAALESGSINNFLKHDMGAKSDFGILLGIVENGIPVFGACANFITQEKIFIDGNDKNNLFRENNKRNYTQKNAVYLDLRGGEQIEQKLKQMEDVELIIQATLGLRSLYTIINPHESAVSVHRVQSAGIWDIMPAAVATRAFGGGIFDDNGNLLSFKDYIMLPGKGATIIKGEKFKFVKDLLKQIPNELNK